MPLPHWTTVCVTCGKTTGVEQSYTVVKGVCSSCADVIANLYNYDHSGKYLTPEFEARVSGGEFNRLEVGS